MKNIFVILIGLLFVVIGIIFFVTGKAKAKRCTIDAIGTVVEIIETRSRDSDGNYKYSYCPVVRYQAGDRTVTKESNISSSTGSTLDLGGISISSSKSKYNVNDKIEIMYNPDNVEEFLIKGDNDSNLLAIIFIFIGSIAVIFGFGIIKPS